MSRDPGLQPERTALSWQRAGVATLLVGGAAAAAAVRRGNPLVVGAALVALALAGVTAVPPRSPSARPLGRRPGRPPGLPPTTPYARLVRAAVATVALAAVGVLLSLT
jgi:Domain of unknown function (DUF202)